MSETLFPIRPKSESSSNSIQELGPQAAQTPLTPSTNFVLHQQTEPQDQQPHQKQQQQQSKSFHKLSSTSQVDQNNSQQFCLRWNNYQTNLTSVFDQLLQNESFVDVTLACEGQSIKAHKIVLSACSPYFQGLFFDNPCQHPTIIMRDVKWTELKSAVEFMYKGEINVSQDQIGPLLRLAEMLKIRGLADVNGEHELHTPQHQKSGLPANLSSTAVDRSTSIQDRSSDKDVMANSPVNFNTSSSKRQRISTPTKEWDIITSANNLCSSSKIGEKAVAPNPNDRKRCWPSTDHNFTGAESPLNKKSPDHFDAHLPILHNSGSSSNPMQLTTPISIQPFAISPQIEAMRLNSLAMTHPDDIEIKPGIAEMIREEERVKIMENSQAWLSPSTSASIADSYQYQLQSMWQACWNTNQNLNHHLRFRERGPLKSWRPETMAEAIFSVLKESLSLSQAARKYDIPYPTFVLYANRVHNMLGPSIEGGIDVRPKGRGRPQRILLGIWPDEHIKGVIKTVVFRDTKEFKEEGMHLSYGRHSPVYPFPD